MNLTLFVKQETIKKFNDALNIYVSAFGKDASDTVKKYCGILIDEVIDRTPPFKTTGDTEGAKLKGQRALLRDIRKTVDPVDWHSFNSRSIQKLIKQKDIEGFRKATANFPTMKGKKIVLFSPSLHTSQRVRGVVPKGLKINQVTLDFPEQRQYEKEMMTHIGRLKASWMPALNVLNRKASSWISRHSSYGFSVTNIDNKLDQPEHRIDIDNHSPGIGKMKSFVNYSMGLIADKMLKDIAFKTKYLLRKSGLKK